MSSKNTEPTEWINSMVTIVKPNKIRICIDPQDLNRAVRREHYPLKTLEEVEPRYFQWWMPIRGFKLCTFTFKRITFKTAEKRMR